MGTGTNKRRSVLMIVTSMLIFGTIGIFRRNIPISSAFLAFFRGTFGGLLLLSYSRLRGGHGTEKLPARTLLWLALSGAIMGVNWILLFEAYNHTTIAVATLCYYMQPTIVMLLAPVLLKEKLTWKKAACAAVAIIGMVLVSGVTTAGGPAPEGLRGVLLGLAAAAFYAAVVIMNKRAGGIDPYRKTTVQLLSAGIVMIPYLVLTGGFGTVGFDRRTVVLLLVVGVVHTGIAYLLYFGSMDGLKAQSVAIFSYIDPVSALLVSAVFLREPLGLSGLLGAALIIGSAVISEMGT